MRSRGFVAIPGDAFGGEDESVPTPLQRLIACDAFWLGIGFTLLCYGSIFLLDALVTARWWAVIAWGAVLPWVAWNARARWRRWAKEV